MDHNNRNNGIYYTPPDLAEYLAKPLIRTPNLSILDPAYGEGALLLAAERLYTSKIDQGYLRLFGCDTKPLNGLLNHLPQANLKKINFFDFPTKHKFPLILVNPPFIRHHSIPKTTLKRLRSKFPQFSMLESSADIWAYFILKSISHLTKNGSIGAILPWAFLQADYAKPLRAILAANFSRIRFLALNKKYFHAAQERVVLVWMQNFGQRVKSIESGSAKHIIEKINFRTVSVNKWVSDRVPVNIGPHDVHNILNEYQRSYHFSRFSEHADVRIGIVTAANNYFIMTSNKAKELGFRTHHLIPILTSSKEFQANLSKGPTELNRLLFLQKKDYASNRGYLQRGISQKYHLRAHSLERTPWYTVKLGEIPDAFFPYRIANTPFLIPNKFRIQSTNSVHRIYFKRLSKIEQKWLMISLISTIGQLSLEVYSKTYGRGMLKVEPSSLKRTLVLVKKDRSINQVYNEVIAALKANHKKMALELATRFLNQYLHVPKYLADESKKALAALQNLRIPTS